MEKKKTCGAVLPNRVRWAYDAPMHIGIIWDQRFTRPGHMTGVGKHILHVVEGLIRDPEVECTVFTAHAKEKGVSPHHSTFSPSEHVEGENAGMCGLTPFSVEGENAGMCGLTPFSFPESLRSLKWRPGKSRTMPVEVDLLYSPMELGLWNGGVPMIPTLHGFPCFEEKLPRMLYRSWRYRLERFHQRRLMTHARDGGFSVCCVSEALAEETVRRFGMDRDRLQVVGNGVEATFFDGPLPPRPSSEAGVVQVGGLNVFDGAVEICTLLPMLEREGIPLDVLGDRHESPYIDWAAGFEVLRLHGFVSGAVLREVLFNARALLFVPEAESFGITGLEALALGVPVIACKTGGVEEVLGDCALWVDPDNPGEILQALQQLERLSDGDYRAWQEKGRARARSFGWTEVVKRVKSVLRCVAEAKRS